MLMLCERDNVGEAIVSGEKTRKAYRRGQLYDIDPESSWAIHFKGVSLEEATEFANQIEQVREPNYLRPVERSAPEDDLMSKFRIA